MVTAISDGGAQNFYLDSKASTIKIRVYSPKFPLEHMRKDIGLALELGDSLEVSPPAGRIVKQVFSATMARGMNRDDFSAVIQAIEMLADIV